MREQQIIIHSSTVVLDASVRCRRLFSSSLFLSFSFWIFNAEINSGILKCLDVCIEIAKVENAAAASIPKCQFFRLYRRVCCDFTDIFFPLTSDCLQSFLIVFGRNSNHLRLARLANLRASTQIPRIEFN